MNRNRHMSSSQGDTPFTQLPPHLLAAKAGDNVSALAMSPLPDGAGSHKEAAHNMLKAGAESQAQVNQMKGGRQRKRGGATKRRMKKSSKKSKKKSKKRLSKKRSTKRKSSSRRRRIHKSRK